MNPTPLFVRNNRWLKIIENGETRFYALLIPTGAAFCVTAFAYGYMAFQQVNAGRATVESQSSHELFQWLREHGTSAILIELIVMTVLTVGAIGTDSWWTSEDSSQIDDSEENA